MIWSFYRTDTRVFTGQTFSGPQLDPSNIPVGCSAYEGEVDHLRTQLDDRGALVDFTPPPEAASVLDSRRRSAAIAEIEQLERQQLRSAFELMDDPQSAVAREHYERRKARIDELRPIITAAPAATKEAS